MKIGDVLWTYHFYGLVPWKEGDAVSADDLGLLVIPFGVEHVALLAHDQCLAGFLEIFFYSTCCFLVVLGAIIGRELSDSSSES